MKKEEEEENGSWTRYIFYFSGEVFLFSGDNNGIFLWNCTWASAQLFLSFKREGTSHPHTNTLGLTDVAGRNLNFFIKLEVFKPFFTADGREGDIIKIAARLMAFLGKYREGHFRGKKRGEL